MKFQRKEKREKNIYCQMNEIKKKPFIYYYFFFVLVIVVGVGIVGCDVSGTSRCIHCILSQYCIAFAQHSVQSHPLTHIHKHTQLLNTRCTKTKFPGRSYFFSLRKFLFYFIRKQAKIYFSILYNFFLFIFFLAALLFLQ